MFAVFVVSSVVGNSWRFTLQDDARQMLSLQGEELTIVQEVCMLFDLRVCSVDNRQLIGSFLACCCVAVVV